MPAEPDNNFFEELKRRNVLRIAAAYLVAAWVLIQIADTVFPYLGVSDRTITFIIILLAIGFIPALAMSWFFELTPGGLVKDDGGDDSPSRRARPGLRGFDYIVIAALALIGAIYLYDQVFTGSRMAATDTGQPSIAVLPFENRSASDDDVFFVEGVHDDILTSLANIGAMKVISRTSVERLADTELSIPEIGAELGVATILEGGVQRAGDTVRVNVQLIDATTDEHLWAGTFDRTLTAENVFAIQSEIATTIADRLSVVVSPREGDRIARVPTENLAAYEAYLLGVQRVRRRTGESLELAISDFDEAIRLDPDFALAYVGLADSYSLLRLYAERPSSEILEPALAAISRAIELDPNNGEAHATLAMIHFDHRTGVDPGPLFERAIDLSPNYAPARQYYADFLTRQGHEDEALAQMRLALELDPLSPIINVMLALLQYSRGEFDEAKARLLRSIEIDPQFARGYGTLSFLELDLGRWPEALVASEEAYRMNPAQQLHRGTQAELFMQLGDMAEADRIIDELSTLAPNHRTTRYATAQLHMLRSDQAAFEYALANWDDRERRGFYLAILMTGYLRQGQPESALTLIESVDDEYAKLPDAPSAAAIGGGNNALAAIAYVRILQAMGREDEAGQWIAALTEYYAGDELAKPGDTGLTQRQLRQLVERAQVYALSGDKRAALDGLSTAVDSGWSQNWMFYFDHESSFDSLRDEPEFQALRAAVQARMTSELERYRSGNVEAPWN